MNKKEHLNAGGVLLHRGIAHAGYEYCSHPLIKHEYQISFDSFSFKYDDQKVADHYALMVRHQINN